MNADTAIETAAVTEPAGRSARTRRVARVSALAGIVGGTAMISSGCTLSDVSAILSILRLLGII